jgi:hypothetical protein
VKTRVFKDFDNFYFFGKPGKIDPSNDTGFFKINFAKTGKN